MLKKILKKIKSKFTNKGISELEDVSIRPSSFIEEFKEYEKMTNEDLGKSLNLNLKQVDLLMNDLLPYDDDLCVALSDTFKQTPWFWLKTYEKYFFNHKVIINEIDSSDMFSFANAEKIGIMISEIIKLDVKGFISFYKIEHMNYKFIYIICHTIKKEIGNDKFKRFFEYIEFSNLKSDEIEYFDWIRKKVILKK